MRSQSSRGASDAAANAAGDGGPTVVYIDGSCRSNPGPGGWAWVVPGGAWACGAERRTTNQRMELTAAIEALRALGGPLVVFSDSAYVVNCFRDEWHVRWKQRGWRSSSRKPVANRDLWEPLIGLWQPRSQDIAWRWVKAHSGNEWNEIADSLAYGAATDQTARRGADTPTA